MTFRGKTTEAESRFPSSPIPDLVEIVLQIGFELLDRLTILARCTTFGFDSFVGLVHLLLTDIGRLASYRY
jgi:hypothetical protein